MDNRSNTIAGWVLGAGIVALGASIVTAEMFHAERPEKMGYPIEGVEIAGDAGGAAAEPPIAAVLATADAAKGEQAFKKCTACHTVDKGAANGTGPNLWGSMGAPLGHVAGFAYSPALKAKGGTWTWEAMNEWLKSPKAYVDGTKMTFAGLGKIEERANLMAFLNSKSDSPLPLPAAPSPAATTDNPAQAAAEAADQPAAGDMGETEPVLNETQAAKGLGSSVTGEATGPAQNKGH
jgi:cytochrome c